jgi:hypothetical protein
MSKKSVKQSINPIAEIVARGAQGLLHLVRDMHSRGVSEEVGQGELNGKTKDGQDIKVKYKYGVKVGLDDFVKKLKNGQKN